MSRKYPVTKFRLPPSSSSLSSLLSQSSFVRSISRLIPSRSLPKGLPLEIRVGLRDGCGERRGPRGRLPHSEFGSLLFLLHLRLRLRSFLLPFPSRSRVAEKVPWSIVPHFATPCGMRLVVGMGCGDDYFAALVVFALAGNCLVLLTCSSWDTSDQNAEQHFNRTTFFPLLSVPLKEAQKPAAGGGLVVLYLAGSVPLSILLQCLNQGILYFYHIGILGAGRGSN